MTQPCAEFTASVGTLKDWRGRFPIPMAKPVSIPGFGEFTFVLGRPFKDFKGVGGKAVFYAKRWVVTEKHTGFAVTKGKGYDTQAEAVMEATLTLQKAGVAKTRDQIKRILVRQEREERRRKEMAHLEALPNER